MPNNEVNPSIESTSDATIESLVFARDLGAAQVREIDVDGNLVLVSPGTLTLTDLEKLRAVPNRTRRSPLFADPASFVAYVGKYGKEDTLLVGSLKNKTVEATIDYDGPDEPRWGDHKATLQTIATPEWKALRAADGKWLSQTETADFFELWNHVVVDPTAAHMAEVAMNLQGTVNATFEARINRANGSANFVCREETETNNVKVPNKVHVAVAPFEGVETEKVMVLLRFRIEGGKPKFQLVVQNADRIETEALRATFARIADETGREVLVAP